ncbi:branched-chain amino acid ABC transporter permease [Bradyrhizobium sp. KB893862 SZCCT0404]|uniref:branched-chain amino acid ABC transporter permease n=1 Tax=Bradyrhizobium sp. KB893862 SZCCT0404 TaxID=2807672 RepID=UPI001BA8791A|nr:branched-chain amino acid ABC transporter permease [Bradyrhizobium sp. KB893862 SZCCT0404]MBR1177006.1 branched-chain amino acid ABC transporter permease [Bradyrhizobium sp. KB893862 SZCCT0404]
MTDILQILANGIPAGMMYALVALGIVLIHNGTNVVHFGYGEQVTLAAYVALVLQLILHFPFWVACVASIVLSALFGLLIYVGVLAPLRRTPLIVQVIATLAIGLGVREGLRAYMGPDPWNFPSLVPNSVYAIGGVYITAANLAVVTISLLLAGALFGFFRWSRYGHAILAACESPRGASIVGVSVRQVSASIWVLASVLAAVAAFLMAPILTLSPEMGLIAIKGFCAAVLGGFVSLPGAIVGGVLLGLIETTAGFYVSTAMKDVVSYAVLIAVVMFMPQGLLGKRQVKKV